MIETKFKDTEVGRIPQDWRIVPFSEIADTYTGLTYSPDNVREYGTLVLRSSNIQNGKLCFINNVFVEMDIPMRAKVQYGDILVCVRNGSKSLIGKSAIITKEAEGMAFGAFMTILRAKKIDNYFLLYLWQSNATQKKVQESLGATINQITNGDFYRFTTAIPVIFEEQKLIGQSLFNIDTLISQLEVLIDKKKAIKQGAMQELLTGKRRLKGFTEPWVEKRIREIGALTGAGVDKLSKPTEMPVRLLNYLDVFHRDHIYDVDLKMKVTASAEKKHNCNVLQGDVFFTPSSEMPFDIALSAVAMEDMNSVCYSYHIYRLRFNIDIDLYYKAYMFKTPEFYNQANQICEGSGKRYVISLTKFREMFVKYPSTKEEQAAIASVITTMDNEIADLETKHSKYIAIKQGMMQQLLTGKIRLI